MPEFNDRRPRESLRVLAKDIKPGDHLIHPDYATPQPVAYAGPNGNTGIVKGGIEIGLGNGTSGVVRSNTKHTVHRLYEDPPNRAWNESGEAMHLPDSPHSKR